MEAISAKPGAERHQAPADRPGQGRPAPSGGRSASPLGRLPLLTPKAEDDRRPRQKTPRRPTVGLLSPKKAIGKRLVRTPAGTKVVSIKTAPESPTYSPEYTPASPSPPRRSGPGIGKGLFVASNGKGKGQWIPPPIRGPPGKMEWSEEEEEEEVVMLRRKVAELQLKVNNMDERVAEAILGQMETDDKMEILRKGLTSKVKRLAKATGNEDLYRPKED